jgi:uncharacterized protein (TIGR03382 family)
MRTLVAALAVALLPHAALACGGMFCNNNQPITQSAERILFAQDGDQIEMHVQIAYQGPPQSFGWLLPVPPDVETTLSSEQLFTQLDATFGPRFQLITEFDEDCPPPPFAADGAGGGPAGGRDNGVNVISREAIGPFDRAILEADDVMVLRAWLDREGFQIPEGTDEKLQPYVDAGAVFVAVKLLPGADTGDIQPLRLTFTASLPSIPIRPTAVATEPDMGLIVHLLGSARAIPKNYRHLQINEAAIDWVGGGQNYADVVSQAADEAGGQGFATDFAGPHEAQLDALLQPIEGERLEGLRAATTLREAVDALGNLNDADLQRVLGDFFELPEGVTPAQFFQCPDCWGNVEWEQAVDGAALAADIEATVNPARAPILALLAGHPYLSRLYTTMSADEMTLDPEFAYNPDLDGQPNVRTATRRIHCAPGGVDMGSDIVLANGLSFALDGGAVPDAIQRQAGETVRGEGVPAAAVIEQMEERGQPIVIDDRTDALAERYNGGMPGGGPGGGPGAGPGAGPGGGGADGGVPGRGADGGDDGCDCDATDGGTPFGLLGLLLGLGLLRRRRS